MDIDTESNLVFCYHRGCGKKFDPNDNKEGDCICHLEEPVFHDAYKIWPCCNKKSIDFTEFLNIKGCTKTVHSNEKPPEPPKTETQKLKVDEETETLPMNEEPPIVRPPLDSPQIELTPHISPSVYDCLREIVTDSEKVDESKLSVGQNCKNKACKATYKGPESMSETCMFHPGVPVFHEGMKYWSCCRKKTTDFSTFLEQEGCTEGTHTWITMGKDKKAECRMDWHQTGTHIFISIYGKKYLPSFSTIKLSPVRLTVNIYFPEIDSTYTLDIELTGVVVVEKSKVNMTPTKVEIILAKRITQYWEKLELSSVIDEVESINDATDVPEESADAQVDLVDLSDL